MVTTSASMPVTALAKVLTNISYIISTSGNAISNIGIFRITAK
jgi:hypothetical protein